MEIYTTYKAETRRTSKNRHKNINEDQKKKNLIFLAPHVWMSIEEEEEGYEHMGNWNSKN